MHMICGKFEVEEGWIGCVVLNGKGRLTVEVEMGLAIYTLVPFSFDKLISCLLTTCGQVGKSS